MKRMTSDDIVKEIFRPKPKPITWRDKAWTDHLRTAPCWLTDIETHDHETVDPAHVGRSGGGMGAKTHDFHVFNLVHSLHREQHAGPEWRFWLHMFTRHKWLVLKAIQALCLVEYLKWKAEAETDVDLVQAVIRGKEAA